MSPDLSAVMSVSLVIVYSRLSHVRDMAAPGPAPIETGHPDIDAMLVEMAGWAAKADAFMAMIDAELRRRGERT